jgi:hypothetical protein
MKHCDVKREDRFKGISATLASDEKWSIEVEIERVATPFGLRLLS